MSSRSVTTPGAARQVPERRRAACERDHAACASVRGQPPTKTTAPSGRTRRAGSRACLEPGGCVVAEDDRGRARRCSPRRRAAGDGRRPPRAPPPAAGARVDDVVELAAARLPAAHRRARGREPAARRARRPAPAGRAVRRGRRRSGSASRPGGLPATATSPPSDTSTPDAGDRSAAAAAMRSAATAFAVAPRSSSTPAGRQTGSATPSSSISRQRPASSLETSTSPRRGGARA